MSDWEAAADKADDLGLLPPFSNSDEGETWMDDWCRNGCIKDRDVDSGNGCPLLLQALVGETPDEWVPSSDYRYVCTSWTPEPVEPDRSGPDPEQPALFAEPPRAPSPEPARTRRIIAALTAAVPRRRPIITVQLPDIHAISRR